MTEKTPKRPKHITKTGTAVYPYLDKPDTKFKEEGEYRTKLRLSAEDAAPIIALVDAEMAVARKLEKLLAAKKDPKNKGKTIPENTPYKDAVDDNGEETGEIEFDFKATASGVSKKNGKPWTRTVDVFDAKKNKIKGAVWGGSKIKVCFSIGSYFINAKVGYGVKLYLEAVQVIELVQGGQRNADGYGFGEEEGYEAADETPADDTPANDGNGDEPTGDDDTDF